MPRSPLHSYNEGLSARFVDFGGWEMPIQYTSVLAEHRAVRESAGWFDVSHLGRFALEGEGSMAALSSLLCNDHQRIGPGRAQYTLMLNPGGGVIDDLIIWKTGPEQVMVMPNGVNHLRVMEEFAAHAPRARLVDLRPRTIGLAVQGPQSLELVRQVLGDAPKRFGVMEVSYRNQQVWVAGTGYTGEAGVELVADPTVGEELVGELTEAGAVPCGLGARDLLRLEAGFPLWGHDLDEETSPLEAGLGWAVRFNRDFVGRDALAEARREGVKRSRVLFRMGDRRIPREGCALAAGDARGKVTSGNFSPMLGVGIGMGYLSNPRDPEAAVEVEIRGRWITTEPVERAFYQPG